MKKIIVLIISIMLITSNTLNIYSIEWEKPKKGEYGYYIEEYKKNTSYNLNLTNPAIGVLSEFLKLWKPGSEYNNGEKLNEEILDKNIQMVIDITNNLNEEEKVQAYIIDRINQSYKSVDGLEEYAEIFRQKTNAKTDITKDIPKDATQKEYFDTNKWADTDKEYQNIVKLMNKSKAEYSTTAFSKYYYSYMRPFRWSDKVDVVDTLIKTLKSEDVAKFNAGFPSGHTTSAYISSITLAYSFPQKYNELMYNASTMANARINAGVHSPLDVMGGRVLATAISASILNNEVDLRQKAYNDGLELLKEDVDKITIKEKITKYNIDKDKFRYYMTYNFDQIGDKNQAYTVPKGAEVLIESRYPYLKKKQLREILKTTAIESGYPILDDEEGWGRLNLFEATGGYGKLEKNTKINLDQNDLWMNNIEGEGSLIKKGTGKLMLSGNNSYLGGTLIKDGEIKMYSQNALGYGNIENKSILSEEVNGKIVSYKNYKQDEIATLVLDIESELDVFQILGDAEFNGILKIIIDEGYNFDKKIKIIEYNNFISGFRDIQITENKKNIKIRLTYENDGVYIQKI